MFNHKKMTDLLKSRSVTQAELAEEVGVTPAAMSFIARGVKTPGLETAARIAKALGVSVDDLLTEDKDE